MSSNNIPFLLIKSEDTKQKKQDSIVWDNALEDLLSQPISADLHSKQVTWKKSTKINSKTIPINIDSAFNPDSSPHSSSSNSNSSHIHPSPHYRAHETKTRELMIRNIIQTPMTPRKKYKLPQTGSTDTKLRSKTCLYDKRELETIMFTRNQKPQPIAQKPSRKIEYTNLTRTFDVHIPISVRSMVRSRNPYFC